jgi:ribosomal protein S27E
MDVKCPGCFSITTVFSHAQTVVMCGSCATVLCQPTGGKARLTGMFGEGRLIILCRGIFFPKEVWLKDEDSVVIINHSLNI